MSSGPKHRAPNRFRLRSTAADDASAMAAQGDETDLPSPVLAQITRDRWPLLSVVEADNLARQVKVGSPGLGIVDRLLAEPGVTEIMINGVHEVWVERDDELHPIDHRLSVNGLNLIIERMLSPLGLRLDRLQPIVDARLPDGSRVNVVAPPLAVDGPLVSIRRFAPNPIPLDAFGPAAVAKLLKWLVSARKSILVVGPTSSGKTTLLNTLSAHIPDDERVITIEDTAELQLLGPHVVRLESRRANSEGVGEVSLRRLVVTALRLRPDRLVVGEVRGAEAFDLLLALTAGHAGSLCTCHGIDAAAGLRRLQMLAALADADLPPELLRLYVLDAIDAVVTVGRSNGRRAVVSIHEVGSKRTDGSTARLSGDSLRKLWPIPSEYAAAPARAKQR